MDHSRKLDYLIFVEGGTHAPEQHFIDVPITEGHGIGVLQSHTFPICVERARRVLFEGQR